jgi:hypothetical protein
MTQRPADAFGNTLSNQRDNVWIWAIFSGVLFSLFVIFSERELRDIAKALLIAAIPLSFFAVTFLFRLEFDADYVSHLFLGRFVISRKPLCDLKRVDVGGSIGAKLTFRDGSSIRFLGADIRLLRDMCRYIDRRRPDQVEMRWNPALSALVGLDRK